MQHLQVNPKKSILITCFFNRKELESMKISIGEVHDKFYI